MDEVAAWEARGGRVAVGGWELFVIDLDPGMAADPVVMIHGYPSSSFDWRHVIDDVAAERRVIAMDLLGYGLSDKPLDHRFSLFEQADLVAAILSERGIDRCALVTHDMGNSVGGELLARELEGSLPVRFGPRVITNGSVYMDLVRLSDGQKLLLELPDEPLPADGAFGADIFKPALAFTFSPAHQPSDAELDAQWRLVERAGGNRILQRLIRYVGERREHEGRWTGAIESHASPLAIVWGELDPIAVLPMAQRLAERSGDATLTVLDGVGHYPMIEDPARFAGALLAGVKR